MKRELHSEGYFDEFPVRQAFEGERPFWAWAEDSSVSTYQSRDPSEACLRHKFPSSLMTCDFSTKAISPSPDIRGLDTTKQEVGSSTHVFYQFLI